MSKCENLAFSAQSAQFQKQGISTNQLCFIFSDYYIFEIVIMNFNTVVLFHIFASYRDASKILICDFSLLFKPEL